MKRRILVKYYYFDRLKNDKMGEASRASGEKAIVFVGKLGGKLRHGRPRRRSYNINTHFKLEYSWNVMAHCDARVGKWRGNWRMEWVASTLHTTSEHGVSSITTADVHTSVSSSRVNWRHRRFKWTRPIIGLINCRTQLSGGQIYVVYYIGINYMFRLLWPSSGW